MQRKSRSVATIRATCPTCGDVELTAGQMQVLVCSADLAAAYAFRCPVCHLMVTKPTDHRVVDVLVSSGVPLRTWDVPAEIEEAHEGPAITWDDLLDFHFRLNEDGWLTRLVNGEGSGNASDLTGPLGA